MEESYQRLIKVLKSSPLGQGIVEGRECLDWPVRKKAMDMEEKNHG
jgi:hypothetical protein